MQKSLLALAVAASLALVSGCASTSGGSSDRLEQTGTKQDVSEAPVSQKNQASNEMTKENLQAEEVLERKEVEGGFQLTQSEWVCAGGSKTEKQSWVNDDIQPLLSLVDAEQYHVILNEKGRAKRLYGRSVDGDYFQWERLSDGQYLKIEPKRFAAETTIRLRFGERTGMDRLGEVQKLAIKQFLKQVQDEDESRTVERYMEKGTVELAFKGLIMNGKLIGPTEILWAKGHLNGEDARFLVD